MDATQLTADLATRINNDKRRLEDKTRRGAMKLIESVMDGQDAKTIQFFETFIRINLVDGGSIEIHATSDGTLEIKA